MGKPYLTKDGDVLDLLCFEEYGTEKAVPTVLDANYHLGEYGAVLPGGLTIVFPDYEPPVEDDSDTLWSE
ncbi:phage tail protein [Vibrio coralliilyticus]|uniref:tail protein X n=1 Tax=Vibrio coralliilyticus TaxID=190893 RepID=UPI00148D2388|nr:tail protein X [Vibrio coralliilyticus]NOI20813.1 phage tail protein [Vibrio coralliilyticus]